MISLGTKFFWPNFTGKVQKEEEELRKKKKEKREEKKKRLAKGNWRCLFIEKNI